MAEARPVDPRLEKVLEAVWAFALICLPITSFPFLSDVSGGIVAPFSILPILILLLLVTLPLLLQKGQLPKETTPLVLFTLAVLVSCAAAFFIFIPGFKGKTITGQEFRSMVTLGVGLTFYLVTVSWLKDTGKLRNTLKYINIGGILSLVWAAIQAYFIINNYNLYPAWVRQIQSWLVVPSPSFFPNIGRVSGFTYEASWFAHQMVIVYLPVWIAATFYKTSAFSIRVFHISLENILLVFGLAAFLLSSPRIGLVSLIILTVYLFLKLNLAFYHWFTRSLSSSKQFSKLYIIKNHKSILGIFASLSMIAIYVLILVGVFLFSLQRDWRLAALVDNPPTRSEIVGMLTLDQNTWLEISHRFVFLERMVYWMNGWNVFNQHPWLGVGLGNAGFFFPQMAPSLGWATFEIRNVLYYLTALPNVKSFWFRLLAETGLVGFSLFIAWFYSLFQSSRFSLHNPDPAIKTLAFAGQLALLAFIGEGLSIDSFAMPYMWVMAGLIAAVAMLSRGEVLHANALH